jgi:hypothetical protein
VHAMKTYVEMELQLHSLSNVVTTAWRWVDGITPFPLLQPWQKSPTYPLNMKSGGLQRRAGWFSEENKLLLLQVIEPRFLHWSACSMATVSTAPVVPNVCPPIIRDPLSVPRGRMKHFFESYCEILLRL